MVTVAITAATPVLNGGKPAHRRRRVRVAATEVIITQLPAADMTRAT